MQLKTQIVESEAKIMIWVTVELVNMHWFYFNKKKCESKARKRKRDKKKSAGERRTKWWFCFLWNDTFFCLRWTWVHSMQYRVFFVHWIFTHSSDSMHSVGVTHIIVTLSASFSCSISLNPILCSRFCCCCCNEWTKQCNLSVIRSNHILCGMICSLVCMCVCVFAILNDMSFVIWSVHNINWFQFDR